MAYVQIRAVRIAGGRWAMAISEAMFFLGAADEGTLQKRLQRIVAEGVLSGRFGIGERLPSSRRLARHLGISRITVTLAYTELVASGYLAARGRSGYFVSDTAPRRPDFVADPQPRQDRVDWDRALHRRFDTPFWSAKPHDWRSYPYPFVYGQTDRRLFDHANWRQCALMALGQRDFSMLADDLYERDDPKLVEFIARHTLPRRGIAADPDQIMVTMGAQNAIWLAAQLLLGPGRRAVVENPCYPGMRDILRQTGSALDAVDIDARGLDPDRIPGGADVVCVTPSHQCPTAATLPLERRRALLDRAGAEDFLILEDDYEFEMSFLAPPSPALKSLDREGRVIYVGSFSKSLFPGLRLGYMVASAPFIREARALRATVLRHPPGHVQRTAAYFLSLGHYDALIRRMSEAFRQRRAVMEEAMAAQGLEVAQKSLPGGGMGGSSFWMRAPAGTDTAALALGLRAEGVLIEPGAAFFDGTTPPRDHYRLAYSSIDAGSIPEGVARIARAIHG